MFESIAVLVIFFILIMFGFIFYTRIQKTSFETELQEKSTLKAIDLSEKIFFLPEIQCSRNNIPQQGCIDKLKLSAATKLIAQNKATYIDIFGNSYLHIEQVYPIEASWILYDQQKQEDSGKISTQFPVSLYDAGTDTYSFGVLYVDLYR